MQPDEITPSDLTEAQQAEARNLAYISHPEPFLDDADSGKQKDLLREAQLEIYKKYHPEVGDGGDG